MAAVLARYGCEVSDRTGWRKVKCPFHDDRMPSASVNTDQGAFVCHSCGIKGDAYAILMSQEHCDFPTALELGDTLDADPNCPGSNVVSTRTKRAYKPPGRRGSR